MIIRKSPVALILACGHFLLSPEAMARAEPVAPIGPVAERIAGFSPGNFLSDRALLTSRLDSEDADEKFEALVNLAALYLAHGFWGEAGELLESIPEEDLSATDRSEVSRMRLLAGLVDPFGDLDPEIATAREDWADASVFRSLLGDGSEADFEKASELILPWPDPIRQRALPALLETAIEREYWEAVPRIAEQLLAHPGLADSPTDFFLRGLSAERNDMPEKALEDYEKAANGSGLWAARARVAWSDLALSSGLRTTEEVHAWLLRARSLWSGGPVGLATLSRLYETMKLLDDPISALDLLADIETRHPGGADRIASVEDRIFLVEAFYDSGFSGRISFDRFLEGHLRLFRDMSVSPWYLDLAEGFAERLSGSGAFGLAMDEYRRINDTLAFQSQSPRLRPPPDRVDRVRLRLAELMIDADLAAEAESLLEAPVLEPAFSDRQEQLRARARFALEDWEGVLETWLLDPDPVHLHLMARSHFALGNWEDARRTYLRLAEKPGMQPGDFEKLILSSFRSGRLVDDEARIRDGVLEEYLPLLESLLEKDLPKAPIDRPGIENRIRTTEAVLSAAEKGVSGMETGERN